MRCRFVRGIVVFEIDGTSNEYDTTPSNIKQYQSEILYQSWRMASAHIPRQEQDIRPIIRILKKQNLGPHIALAILDFVFARIPIILIFFGVVALWASVHASGFRSPRVIIPTIILAIIFITFIIATIGKARRLAGLKMPPKWPPRKTSKTGTTCKDCLPWILGSGSENCWLGKQTRGSSKKQSVSPSRRF
jgi:hypothetical protein